jgi:uncharacterized repeat protein (TIGR02543 family)
MATSYTNDGMFDAVGTNTDSYRLNIEARTTRVTGGTLVEIFGSVTKTRTHGSVATTGGGTRSWSLPGGRTAISGGTANASGSSSWSYAFPAASTNTENVYNYFNVYVTDAYAAANSNKTTLTLTASGSGSSFLTSKTLSVSVPLEQPPAVQLGAPTGLSVTGVNTGTASSTGNKVEWTAVSGVTTYGIWWNTSATGPTTGASPDIPGITGTSKLDVQVAGTTRHYWVSSQTVGTPSAWIYAGSATVPPSTVNLTYNFNGNGSSDVTTPVTPGTTFTLRSAPTRSGYTFDGWNDDGGNSYGSTGTSSRSAPSTAFTLYAQWTLIPITPSFTESSVATPATMGTAYFDGVTATNASSYSVFSGALPVGISLNTTTGAITGTPTSQGSSTFVIRATSSTSNTANTESLTITVLPPGQRFTSTSAKTRLTFARRFIGIGGTTTNAQGQTISADATGYVNLSRMMVYKSGQWVHMSNIN